MFLYFIDIQLQFIYLFLKKASYYQNNRPIEVKVDFSENCEGDNMKIAAVVVTYNDDFRFNEWMEYHKSYKDELYLHIIVDNGSEPEYIKKVEQHFTNSHIIKRTNNGGLTGAYNDGIRHALVDPEVDAIMLIGNDIKLEKGGVTKLYEFLNSDLRYGMVSPVLLKKDSELIESFGVIINPKTFVFEPQNVNLPLSDLKNYFIISDTVPGGINIAKRIFYEVVGLQDEYLFMYGDEVDMGIRARKCNFLMAVTKRVFSWHQHINTNHSVARIPLARYLIGRNKIYLIKKHFGIYTLLSAALIGIKIVARINVGVWVKNRTSSEKIDDWYFIKGVFAGIFNIKKIIIEKYVFP